MWNKETIYCQTFSTFALERSIKRAQKGWSYWDWLKAQILINDNNVYLLDENINTAKEDTKTLLVASN
jgi:hypothetical protein